MADKSSQEVQEQPSPTGTDGQVRTTGSQEPRISFLRKTLARLKSKNNQTPQEEPPKGILDQNLSRRKLLKGAGRLAAGAAIGAVVGTGKAEVAESGHEEPKPEPLVLPDDVLTKEQLAKAHIRIIDEHTDTKLFLREKALEQFKLFRDTKSGQVDEAVIVLVDGDSLSWKNGGSLPPEAKDIYQAINYAPGEKEVEDYFWDIESRERNLVYYRDLLKSNGPFQPTSPEAQANGWQDLSTADKVAKYIKEQEETISKLKAKGPPTLTPQERDAQASYSSSWGEITHTYNGILAQNPLAGQPRAERIRKVKEKYPALENKVYIFLAVGKDSYTEPSPEQSRPTPDRFVSYTGDHRGYIFGNKTPGFVLAHELKHWKGKIGKFGVFYNETKTDAQTFSRMADASDLLIEENDDSGYSFVFRNRRGITITANPKRESVPAI